MGASGSSSTSSPTSASWSTSDPAPGGGARLLGWVRLSHPFPSVLDGLVCSAVALLAGGPPSVVFPIGVGMTLLQLGIGTVNDVVDAPRDAGRKPGKPIPAGLVRIETARVVAVLLFVSGTALAGAISPLLAALAVVVIAIGLAYDLRLKGTAWSWLPFAVGIPILPVFGWVGAAGTVPAAFAALIPAAVAAGAALAIGNTLVDVDRDRAAGISSVALALGPDRAARLALGLLALVSLSAVASAVAATAAPVWIGLLAALGAVPIAAASVAARAFGGGGEPASRPAPQPDPRLGVAEQLAARRERAWQAEAIGLAVLAACWLAAVLGPGRSSL